MKEWERKQRCTNQLVEFQENGTHLSLKAVTALQAVHESQREVNAKIVEYILEKDVTDCKEISEKMKEQVEEFKQQYENLKIKISDYTISN